jgi:hypothetical protein
MKTNNINAVSGITRAADARFMIIGLSPCGLCQSARQGVGCCPRYTVTKVGQSDGEGTFAGARGNDEVAPIPNIHGPPTETA